MTVRSVETKVLERADFVERYRRPRERSVAFTNGVFDVLHRGHAVYLEQASALADVLVVGVNSDASTRRLTKGPGRPLNGAADRAALLAALGCVDAVTCFVEDTPASLIRELIPDVLVKGGDYTVDQVAGREVVEAAGGRVVIIPFLEGYSTTRLVERIKESS